MRGPLTVEIVAELARCAGFEFSAERCTLLAPQLDWLLAEASQLENLGLEDEEPLTMYYADRVAAARGEE
jgi:hypothetical protein